MNSIMKAMPTSDDAFGEGTIRIMNGSPRFVENQLWMAEDIAERREVTRARPTKISICPSTYCNYDCIMCDHGRTPRRELPPEIWDELPDFICQQVVERYYDYEASGAWDKADTNDIREFTTPEMFAELRMQIQERGASPNHTDVVTLDAQLLGIENSGDDHLASVKFSGMIREADNAPAEPFAEVWNLTKPASGQGGWTLAGIQQLS